MHAWVSSQHCNTFELLAPLNCIYAGHVVGYDLVSRNLLL
jgi:hypothetical protein